MSNINPLNDAYSPPSKPVSSESRQFDSAGLLGESVNDINTLTSRDNPLMKQAATKGKQYANSRGLLNSSLSAGAVESSRLDTVMPLVQQNAQTRGQYSLQDSSQKFQAGESALNREFDSSERGLDRKFQAGESLLGREKDLTMQERGNLFKSGESALDRDFNASERGLDRNLQSSESEKDRGFRGGEAALDRDFNAGERGLDRNLQSSESEKDRGFRGDEAALNRDQEFKMLSEEYGFREEMVGLEQRWNQVIQSDVNATAFWQSSIDGLMAIMGNDKMTTGQTEAALNEMLGYTDDTGYNPGTISSGLDFIQRLAASGTASTGRRSPSDDSPNEGLLGDAGESDGAPVNPVNPVNPVDPFDPTNPTNVDDVVSYIPGGKDNADLAASEPSLDNVDLSKYVNPGDKTSDVYGKIAEDYASPAPKGSPFKFAGQNDEAKMALAISMYENEWVPSDGNPRLSEGGVVQGRADVYLEKYFDPGDSAWAAGGQYKDGNTFTASAKKEVPAQIMLYYRNMPEFSFDERGTRGVVFGSDKSFFPGGGSIGGGKKTAISQSLIDEAVASGNISRELANNLARTGTLTEEYARELINRKK